MPRKRLKEIYERVFFDPLMLVGVIFVCLTYILRDTWAGAFTESAAFIVGIVWSYRAATTHPRLVYRLLAALVMVLIGSLLAVYLGAAHGLI